MAGLGLVLAEEIGDILTEFSIFDKVVAATVDNAANMDVAIKKAAICEARLLCSHTQCSCTKALLIDCSHSVDGEDLWHHRVGEEVVHGQVLREKQDFLSKNH